MRYGRFAPIVLLVAGCAPHFTGSHYIQHIAFLASDDLAGRAIGTPGIDQAAEYIAWQFHEAGLRPGGDHGTYFQDFEIPMGMELLGRPSLTVAGAPAVGLLGTDFATFPFSAADKFEGPLAFVGFGISNPKEQYDDYEGFDAAGKVLLMLRYEPRSADPKAKFGGLSPSPHAAFQTKATLARVKGARAILIVNPPLLHGGEDRLFAFNTVDNPGRFGLPMLHVSREYADRLLKAAGADDLKTLQRDLEKRKTRTMDLKGLLARGDPGLVRRKIHARNVIAELPGSGPDADEYVVIGAHYDHIGRVLPRKRTSGKPNEPEQPQIHHGADDNASGTSGVIELARAFARQGSPGRSMLFMAFSAEEEGLLGSAHYVSHPTVPMQNIVTMVNLDMIGRLRNNRLEVYGTDTATQFSQLVKYHGDLLGLGLKLTGSGYGGSDQSSFLSKRVPVLFFITGMHPDYHMPTDTADKINADGGARVVQLAYSVARSLAAAPGRPTTPTLAQKDQKAPERQQGQRPSPRAGLKVRLGVMPSYAEDDKPGLLIQGASDGSPAQQAGLREGDRILKVGQIQTDNIYDLMQALKGYNPGDETKILALRDGKRMELKVKFEAANEENAASEKTGEQKKGDEERGKQEEKE